MFQLFRCLVDRVIFRCLGQCTECFPFAVTDILSLPKLCNFFDEPFKFLPTFSEIERLTEIRCGLPDLAEFDGEASDFLRQLYQLRLFSFEIDLGIGGILIGDILHQRLMSIKEILQTL